MYTKLYLYSCIVICFIVQEQSLFLMNYIQFYQSGLIEGASRDLSKFVSFSVIYCYREVNQAVDFLVVKGSFCPNLSFWYSFF